MVRKKNKRKHPFPKVMGVYDHDNIIYLVKNTCYLGVLEWKKKKVLRYWDEEGVLEFAVLFGWVVVFCWGEGG